MSTQPSDQPQRSASLAGTSNRNQGIFVPDQENFAPLLTSLEDSQAYAIQAYSDHASASLQTPASLTPITSQHGTSPVDRLSNILHAEVDMVAEPIDGVSRIITAEKVLGMCTHQHHAGQVDDPHDPTYELHMFKSGERALQTIQANIDHRFPAINPPDLVNLELRRKHNDMRRIKLLDGHQEARYRRACQLERRLDTLAWHDTERFTLGALLLQIASGERCTYFHPDMRREILPAITGDVDEGWQPTMHDFSVWALLAMSRCLSKCYGGSSVAIWGKHITVGSFDWYWGP